ncbi:MAG: DUF1800 family protein [Bacteroidota bacterium]|nr:DUF1800 family protein [Bacteroidota bacterium]MDP4237574.1 DUF1800 family protein [Bacteroidota bacterium]
MHTINHLYRRAGFGATLSEINAAVAKTPSELIDDLLDDKLLTGNYLPADPRYAFQWKDVVPYTGTDLYQKARQETTYNNAAMELRRHWTVQMCQPETMLREKLTVFWMNHFVIEARKVKYPICIYDYLSYFRQNPWGNFKKMVADVTTSPAMLIYLDGILNAGSAPNENYARELQELFTMGAFDKNGKSNYTQSDVEGLAHALTGWTVDTTQQSPKILPAIYNSGLHDQSKQVIYDNIERQYNLTASGDAMDKDVINHIFEQRSEQIAWFICTKLYQYFVYANTAGAIEQAVISEMADLLRASNWELKPVLSALLNSSHFFDEENIGALIKSPYEHIIGLLRPFEILLPENTSDGQGELMAGSLYNYALAGSQELLDPPNVKGWPGYHTWISATTLPFRETYIQTALLIGGNIAAEGVDGYGQNNYPIFLLDGMVTSWGQSFTNYAGAFDDLVHEIATYLCAHTPSAKALAHVKSKFASNISYEWSDQTITTSERVGILRQLANEIMLLADYQLS